MSPTWLEAAVALLLLWVAWKIGVLLTAMLLRRFRGVPPVVGGEEENSQPDSPPTIQRLRNKEHGS